MISTNQCNVGLFTNSPFHRYEFHGVFIKNCPLKSGWVVYGPENGYNFPYPRLLRVNINIFAGEHKIA